MPRPAASRVATLVGAGLALVLAACGSPAAAPAAAQASPTPVPTLAPSSPSGLGWVEDLTFSGDLAGTMNVVVPNQPGQESECSGKNSRTGGTWASTVYGLLRNQKYGVAFLAPQYRGPGTYTEIVASVQVFNPDHSRVWQSLGTDPVTLTVDAEEESGQVDATLTNVATGKTKLKVKGGWSCRT